MLKKNFYVPHHLWLTSSAPLRVQSVRNREINDYFERGKATNVSRKERSFLCSAGKG